MNQAERVKLDELYKTLLILQILAKEQQHIIRIEDFASSFGLIQTNDFWEDFPHLLAYVSSTGASWCSDGEGGLHHEGPRRRRDGNTQEFSRLDTETTRALTLLSTHSLDTHTPT